MGPRIHRQRSSVGFIVPLVLIFAPVIAAAAVKPYISAVAEYSTECKTCPYSLCTNKLYYDGGDNLTTTCWTRGSKIVGDNLWLKTDSGCYVTQYDLVEYEGDYREDLEYCGRASEEEHITEEDATLQYKSECQICPYLGCDIVAYLPEETDVTLTCWTKEGQLVINDPIWLKTTDNCYVAQIGLHDKPDLTYLDSCGPIPTNLEIDTHNPSNTTDQIAKRDTLKQPDVMGPNYLINVTVGEDWAYCRSCAKESCKVEKKYRFNTEVWLQCLVNNNGTWWSETTDFCYVKNSDFWESPEGDNYRFPLCEYFEDPDSSWR